MLVAAFALGGAGAAAAGVKTYGEQLPWSRALPGVTVEDRVQPPDITLGDWLEAERRRLLEREVYLHLPDGVEPTTLGELGVELEVQETMTRVLAHTRQGSVVERWERSRRARRGEEHVEASFTFDAARARQTLLRLAPAVHRDPIDARQDLELHLNVEDQPGRDLDVDASLELIDSAGHAEGELIPVALRPIRAQVTADMLQAIDVSKVLASFDTSFRNKAGARAINIAVAAKYLDGAVIAPGQTFSFNQVVGPRTSARGFVEAPVIVEDELEPGLGGGVCQVATALHAAAVFGWFDVLQRRSHSRPSGYAPLGLDATVIWGEMDLKIRNPYDRPVMIHASLPGEFLLRVELLGIDPPGKVEHTYAVTEKHDFVRRVRTKSELGADQHKRRQKGIAGYDVVSTVRIEYPDGRTGRRSYPSKYWPVPEVYWVGPSYDVSQLPELPEGASGVELLGEIGHGALAEDHAASTGFGVDAEPSG
jgi:vancomycin resistance protein YoaR